MERLSHLVLRQKCQDFITDYMQEVKERKESKTTRY